MVVLAQVWSGRKDEMESPKGSILRGGGRLCGVRGGGRWQRQTGLWSNSGHQNGTQVINKVSRGGKEGDAS